MHKLFETNFICSEMEPLITLISCQSKTSCSTTVWGILVCLFVFVLFVWFSLNQTNFNNPHFVDAAGGGKREEEQFLKFPLEKNER